MYRNKKMFILKKALYYTHICQIFKLKSLNGMPKYKVKMFFYYSSLILDKNIVFKYIIIKPYNSTFFFDF